MNSMHSVIISKLVLCLLLCTTVNSLAQTTGKNSKYLELRLEGRISQTQPAGPNLTAEPLLRFGRSDLQRRLELSRQRTQLLNMENVYVQREIVINETLIRRLQQLGDSRGQTASVVREVIQERALPKLAVSPPVVSAPQVKVVQLAPGALALDYNLIPGLEDWILIAALGGIIVLLLAWVLRLYAGYRMLQARELTLEESAPSTKLDAAKTSAPQPSVKPATSPTPSKVAKPEDSLVADGIPSVSASPATEPKAVLADSKQPVNPLSGELKEIDTLIAFEQFNQAREILNDLLKKSPNNPEYLLRHYHLCSINEDEADEEDEAMLRALMDGPLSDTLLRVKAMGQSMMPGDPLFSDKASRDEALRVMDEAKQVTQATDLDLEEEQDSFNSTMILTPAAGELTGNRKP